MAVALVNSSRSGASDASGTTCTVPVPSGAASGHIALIGMKHWETFDATGITWPSGFTQIISVLTGNRQKLYVAWKRLTGADSGNYTITWTSSQWHQGHCILISGGLASGDPIEATNTASGTGTSIPSTSVTTATLAFLAHFVDSENAAAQSTVPTNFTLALDGDYLRVNYRIPGSSGVFSAASGALDTSTAKNAALIAVKPAAGGPTSLAANTATESDTAPSLGKRKSKAATFPTESDTAVSITRKKARSATLAAETDTALGFTRSKRKTAQIASESDLALPIGMVSGKAVNTATETDTAPVVGRAKRKPIGTALETDTAFTFGIISGIRVPIGTALETDAARPFTYTRARAVGTALETDTALPATFTNPAWQLVMPQIVERFTFRGGLSTTLSREATVFGDENGLFTTERGSPSPGSDEYGAIPYATKYIWYGGHVNTTDDPAVKNLWLAHGFEVENVTLP